jgi:hypothetical protein
MLVGQNPFGARPLLVEPGSTFYIPRLFLAMFHRAMSCYFGVHIPISPQLNIIVFLVRMIRSSSTIQQEKYGGGDMKIRSVNTLATQLDDLSRRVEMLENAFRFHMLHQTDFESKVEQVLQLLEEKLRVRV